MKAIILVAGYATRMYPLTLDRPKPLLPLNGRPVIDYIIDQLNTLPGLSEIVLVSNHKFFAHFQEWQKTAPTEIPITVLDDGSTTEHDRLGAIGDIAFALRERNINDDVVILAGDNYQTYPLIEQYQFFNEKQSDTLCAKKIDDPELLHRVAVAVLDDDGKILEMIEKPANPPSDTGIFATYFYKAETLPLIKRYLDEGNNPDAPGFFPQWLCKVKDIYAYTMRGDCFDIGTISAYEEMQKMLAQQA